MTETPPGIIVLKLGTSSIVNDTTLVPSLGTLSRLVECIHTLRTQPSPWQVVLVTSGAVGMGMRRLGWNADARPTALPALQAVAAIGQGRLMAMYDQLFSLYNIPIGQVLLTRDSLGDRSSYRNACSTLRQLLSMGVLPIINENDTVSNAELRFGDNDTLSAVAAGMVDAACLVLLTDVDALYTGNPRVDAGATRIAVVEDVGHIRQQVSYQSSGSQLGKGGMVTKLIAVSCFGRVCLT
jgi:glutamate 5-kinase